MKNRAGVSIVVLVGLTYCGPLAARCAPARTLVSHATGQAIAEAKMIALVMRQAQRLRPQLLREIRARRQRYGPSDRVVRRDRSVLRQIDRGLAFYWKAPCQQAGGSRLPAQRPNKRGRG